MYNHKNCSLFFATENIPFCCHRDNSKYFEMIDTGSFQTLLNFTVESDGVIFKEHFDTSPTNAIYWSKSTQDDISCCAGVMNKK